jgi:membrane-bound lytic murein transglycosylase F
MAKTKALVLLFALLLCSVTSMSASDLSEQQISMLIRNYDLSSFEIQKFVEHSSERLPTYKKYFEKYSELYDIPWTLLAAVAYQESKWDDKARSYTGVRGLMQLTSQTAEHVGIEDQSDPLQSIQGGAYYMKYLYDKTPKTLAENLRWIQALSAYNIGWGHLRDAHRLGAKLKKSAYVWSDLKFLLPKLEDEKYYSELKYGFARGNETVDFVDKVFTYYRMLNDTFSEEATIAGL